MSWRLFAEDTEMLVGRVALAHGVSQERAIERLILHGAWLEQMLAQGRQIPCCPNGDITEHTFAGYPR